MFCTISIGKFANVNTTSYHSLFASVRYRFVDRDMSMRYLLGLGVGHTYAHTNIHGRDLGGIPEEVPDQNDVGNGSDAGEGTGMMHGLEEAGGEDTGDGLDKIGDDDDEQDYREDEEDDEEGEGEEEDFDKGSDYTDDESIPSETGGSQDSEDEEEY